MAARFCPACGTQAVPAAKFCTECGASLASGRTAAASEWRFSPVGAGVLGVFLVAGLTIWTVILSPAPPKPGPGTGRTPQQTASAAPADATRDDLPPGHPQVPAQIPDEVKRFIDDLAARAKAAPEDADLWTRLAQVNVRASQIDPSYAGAAADAWQRVLVLRPEQPEALQGLANLYYDRNDAKQAIPYYERYLKLRPDDASARTDLGTMYLYAGEEAKAVATYQDVIRRNPTFLQAHYNLAITHHRRGDDAAALAELQTARGLAGEDTVRRQIDEMIAALGGQPPAGAGAAAAPAGAPGEAGGSPFQRKVEEDLRAQPILGPRVVRVEWSGPGTGRVIVQNFPMDGMPDEVREKFRGRVAEQLRTAETADKPGGDVRLEIADADTGRVMETVTP